MSTLVWAVSFSCFMAGKFPLVENANLNLTGPPSFSLSGSDEQVATLTEDRKKVETLFS